MPAILANLPNNGIIPANHRVEKSVGKTPTEWEGDSSPTAEREHYMKQKASIIATLVVASAALINVEAQTWLTNGLVAYYPFNGNANDVAGTNNGTVYGATMTANRFGEANQAYFFDGQNSIVANDQAVPKGNASRTFSLWVNCRTVNTNRAYAIPFKYGTLGTGQGNWINVFTGSDGTGRPIGTVDFDFYNSWTLTTTLIGLNTWQHLVCTLQSPTTATVYINGKLAGVSSVNANTQSSGELFLGAFDQSGGFLGELDDVRIYSRALSEAEVQQLYAIESGPRMNLIKAVKPSFSYLTLTTNYQLQVSADMSTWTNQGSVFTATNTSMVYPQYFDVANWNSLFFRLQVAP